MTDPVVPHMPRWRRLVRAAGRLAALYVATALMLLVAVVALMDGVIPTFSELLELWIPLSVAFLIVFLLLAIARRAGFVGFWVILLGLWVLILRDVPHAGLAKGFLAWTVLALPLYAMGMIGAPSTSRLLRIASMGIAIIWFCLLVAAFAVARNGSVIWVAFPFVLCVYEIIRVWKATGQISAASGL
jgi:hypothetical protein